LSARQRSTRELREFGRKLRWERKQVGMTQNQVAFKLGTYQGRISIWETGKEEPERKNLVALEDALGITDGRLARALGYRFEISDFLGWAHTYEHQDAEEAIRSDRDIPLEVRGLLASLVTSAKAGASREELRDSLAG
jgi:transcriptional regulator with XRE-family HTH domain